MRGIEYVRDQTIDGLTFNEIAAMERHVPLIGRLAGVVGQLAGAVVGRLIVAVALSAACAAGAGSLAASANDSRLVLVASASSPLDSLTPAEVRRLYLGIPLTHAGREITALRNAESAVVKEMFLQHVLFMSSQAYERQLSARVYKSGGSRIPEFTELKTLLDVLAADPHAVTYMQSETASRRPGIKVLAEL